jgi:uncharacterized protein (DUF2461 family)
MPRGYPADHEAGDLLRNVSYTVGRSVTDTEVLDPRLAQRIEKDFVVALPLVRWLNEALGYKAANSR